MGSWVHIAAFRDCEWYWNARFAAVGHKGQCIENSAGASAPDSGPALERQAEIADRGEIKKLRRIEAILSQLPHDAVRDLAYAFEPFGIERTWLTLQKAFTRHGLNVLQIAERSHATHAECRAAYKLTDADAPLEPVMVREWLGSTLRKHHQGSTQLPNTHVVARMAELAEKRVAECLAMYEAIAVAVRREEADRVEYRGDHALPGEVA